MDQRFLSMNTTHLNFGSTVASEVSSLNVLSWSDLDFKGQQLEIWFNPYNPSPPFSPPSNNRLLTEFIAEEVDGLPNNTWTKIHIDFWTLYQDTLKEGQAVWEILIWNNNLVAVPIFYLDDIIVLSGSCTYYVLLMLGLTANNKNTGSQLCWCIQEFCSDPVFTVI